MVSGWMWATLSANPRTVTGTGRLRRRETPTALGEAATTRHDEGHLLVERIRPFSQFTLLNNTFQESVRPPGLHEAVRFLARTWEVRQVRPVQVPFRLEGWEAVLFSSSANVHTIHSMIRLFARPLNNGADPYLSTTSVLVNFEIHTNYRNN